MQSSYPSARRILTKKSWSTYCSYLQMQSHLQLWALQSGVLASHRVGGRMNGGGSEQTDLDLCVCTILSGFALCLFVCLLGFLSIARIRTFLTCWLQVKMHVLNLPQARLHPFHPFLSISDDSLRTLSTRLYANMSIRLYESLMRSSAELKMWRTRVKQCKSKTISFNVLKCRTS